IHAIAPPRAKCPFFRVTARITGSSTCTSVRALLFARTSNWHRCCELDLLHEGELSLPRSHEEEIRAYYYALFHAWGPQHWWPARTRFEVIVGAYLTQNTAWTNVEYALANLRVARKLSIARIRDARLTELEKLIRPSGYFRQKAKRLKAFVA